MATVNGKMTAIADAIRGKTGETEPLTLDDMATDIPKVFDAGKQVQYDKFWDEFQNYGNGNYLHRMFAHKTWHDKVYHPKYTIKPESGDVSYSNVFYNSYITDTKVPIDIRGCTNADAAFRFSRIVTIPELIVDETTAYGTAAGGAFSSATYLENIKITGVIGNDPNMKDCKKLTHASLMSITNALKDCSDLGTTCTLTLGTTNLAKLTDEEKALATQKGWTLA